jgi:hypothetical protein
MAASIVAIFVATIYSITKLLSILAAFAIDARPHAFLYEGIVLKPPAAGEADPLPRIALPCH